MSAATRCIQLEQIPLIELRGIGPKLNQQLGQIGLHTVLDLLFHLPRTYQDRTRLHALRDLVPGQHCLIQATVVDSGVQFGRRRSWSVQLSDGSGRMGLRFFHFSKAQQNALQKGQTLRCFGEVRHGPTGLEMVHPEYEHVSENALFCHEELTPVYPTTEGVRQQTMRQLTEQALNLLHQSVEGLVDYLPRDKLPKQFDYSLAQAVQILHRPPAAQFHQVQQLHDHPARKRLAFEELLAHQLSLAQVKNKRLQKTAWALSMMPLRASQVLQQCEFQLTGAQHRVIMEILTDIGQPQPMHRLVQGDVGSGKTVIAAIAAEAAAQAQFQVAFMVPTEILAEQHYENFKLWFEPVGIQVELLTGKTPAAERKKILRHVESGDTQIVLGTHALFQNEVRFNQLALVIIDEQHRFGVRQRLALNQKGDHKQVEPHQLVMTATPIPRTLAMVNYADLDLSVIDELPPGRQPIETTVLSNQKRADIIQRLKQTSAMGRQIYWVCTLIDESELMQAQAAEETFESLQQLLPELRIDLVHGRMKADQRRATMQRFKQGEADILVATTVIEVGVDVPNATTMIIENAERLGLSQLHQLRGRVGRGSDKSYCILMYQAPLSQLAKARLSVMRESQDGFAIAQRDLEIRGPGELLGTRQTGVAQFRIANLELDEDCLSDVVNMAHELQKSHPHLVLPLIQRWLGDKDSFSHA